MISVANEAELRTALSTAQAGDTIALSQSVTATSTVLLPEGVTLTGHGKLPLVLAFAQGDGIGLSKDSAVENLAVQTQASSRAVYIQSVAEDLGTLRLNNLRVTGVVQLVLRQPSMRARIEAKNVDVVSADARPYAEQQLKYGVVVTQGAFTIHNFNANPDSLVTATLDNISAGRLEAPVVGSGVYVAGFSDEGGRVEVDTLTTGEVHSNGLIPQGLPNMITGGIFVLSGAHVRELVSKEVVYTYGVNDMTLDVWGEVDSWITEKPVRSYGTSGIGFVNFGTVHYFEAKDVIETFGGGARAFNQYDGTIDKAKFHELRTHGDGSIGMQISQPVGTIEIVKNIETMGGIGDSLVKGVIMRLEATALSLQPGAEVKKLEVGGDLVTHGDKLTSVRVNGGKVSEFVHHGAIRALGKEAQDLIVENDGKL